jgi:hypothetical protein
VNGVSLAAPYGMSPINASANGATPLPQSGMFWAATRQFRVVRLNRTTALASFIFMGVSLTWCQTVATVAAAYVDAVARA